MTIDEFLVRVAETPRAWRLDGIGRIRCGEHRCPACPITEVASPGRGCLYAATSARELGLSEPDLAAVLRAADNSTVHDKDLRLRLLTACGLGGDA